MKKTHRLFILAALSVLAAGSTHAALSISPSSAGACQGDEVALTATGASDPTTIQWSLDTGTAPTLQSDSGAKNTLHIGGAGVIKVKASSGADMATSEITVVDCPSRDEVVRAIVGFEQEGASGTSSGQGFLFDFFITRPIQSHRRLRWWGNVKIASFPQQVNTDLATFSTQFTQTFGMLKVNQLAQSAEFVTGPELWLGSDRDRFRLSLFAGGGASGPNNPSDNVVVFSVPGANSPQLAQFTKQFPGVPMGTTNVAFLPESSNRFLRQWQGGVRLYTFYKNSKNGLGSLPGTVEFSIGQNELVTGAHLSGLVGHVAATHPFTFPSSDPSKPGVTVYFFGEVTNAYTRRAFESPLPLAPAVDAKGNPIALTDPTVFTLTVPANRRDTYRIGVGLDLISVFNTLWSKK